MNVSDFNFGDFASKPASTKLMLTVLVLFMILQVVSLALMGVAIYGGSMNTSSFDVKMTKTGKKFLAFMSLVFLATAAISFVLYMKNSCGMMFNAATERSCGLLATDHVITIMLTIQLFGAILMLSMFNGGVQKGNYYSFKLSSLDLTILKVAFPIVAFSSVAGVWYMIKNTV